MGLITMFALTVFLVYLQPEKPKRLYILYCFWGVLLILMAGFRSPGLDYLNYVSVFYGDNTKSIEPAIVIISWLIRSFTQNHLFLFVIFAALGVSIKFRAIRQLTGLWFLSVLIYLSYNYLYHEMIQIRAGIASGILLLCIKPLSDRNWKLFLILCTIAISFHISALLIFPLWILQNQNFNKRLYLGIILGSYLFAIIGMNFSYLIGFIPIERVQLLFKGYVYSTQQGIQSDYLNIFSVLQMMRVGICLFLIFHLEKLSNSNKYAPILLKIYSLSVASYVLFSDLPVLAVRISQLLGVVEIVLIPLIIYIFTERSRRIAILLPVIIGCVMLGLIVFYRKLIV